MKYFKVEFEYKSHSDAPNPTFIDIIPAETREEAEQICNETSGLECWNILCEVSKDSYDEFYG